MQKHRHGPRTWHDFSVLYLERNVVTVGLSYRLQPSVTVTHIHNLYTGSCPILLTFPIRPRQLLLDCATHTDCSWLIRIRGSHEEALGFHGTLLRIDPPLSGTSPTKDTNT